MSWWVMEQVSVNEAGTQTLANIQCDDVSDLPAPNQSATLGYIIVRGSQAKVLATSENYILGSTGTWVKMEDGVKLDLAGYATEQYVNDGLADKVDTSVYSSGQAAQDAIIAGKAGVSSIPISLAGSPLSVSEWEYSAIVTGDIITVHMRIIPDVDLAINASRTIGQMPSRYYPPYACPGTGYANNILRQFWINTSGNIKMRIDELIPAGSSIICSFTYSYKAANWTANIN